MVRMQSIGSLLPKLNRRRPSGPAWMEIDRMKTALSRVSARLIPRFRSITADRLRRRPGRSAGYQSVQPNAMSLFLLPALLLLVVGCMGDQGGDAVARINGNALQREEFDHRVASLLIQNDLTPEDAPAGVLRQAHSVVLEAMIGQSLMYEAAVEAGVEVSPDEVELELSFARARYASRDEFQQELKRRGLTEESYKENLAHELAIQKYVESELAKEITLSDEEVRAYYDANPAEFNRAPSVQLRQVVVRVARGATEEQVNEARVAAERARERIRTGQEFADVAQEVSDDGSAARGGMVGDITLDELVSPLREAVADLPIGELSPVLQSRFGFHVLRVEARQEAKALTFADAEEMIRQQLLEERKQAARDRWLRELRAAARVEILDADLIGGGAA
jgi:peptidyl-prolyl cis-trans isomerase C